MRRDSVQLNVPGTDLHPTVVAYGHWGRPLLVFPSEGGSAWDYENNGMVGAVADLVDAGRTDPGEGGRPGVRTQTLALYALLDELRRRHPGVEIESCASGGARVDLGILHDGDQDHRRHERPQQQREDDEDHDEHDRDDHVAVAG